MSAPHLHVNINHTWVLKQLMTLRFCRRRSQEFPPRISCNKATYFKWRQSVVILLCNQIISNELSYIFQHTFYRLILRKGSFNRYSPFLRSIFFKCRSISGRYILSMWLQTPYFTPFSGTLWIWKSDWMALFKCILTVGDNEYNYDWQLLIYNLVIVLHILYFVVALEPRTDLLKRK